MRRESRSDRTSLKYLGLVKLNARFFQQVKELFFKTLSLVMFRLILNVVPHGVHFRGTDRERTIAFLPSGPGAVFAKPPRRIRLQLLRRLSDRDMRGKAKQHMDMIFCSTDRPAS